MHDVDQHRLDKRRVRASFDRVAVLQREIGTRLLERLDYVRLRPAVAVDVGAGTGHLSKALARRYPDAQVIALDLAMDAERRTLTYSDVRGLMHELKTLGAHNAAAGRTRGLTGRGRLRAMMDAYESLRRDGVLPATFEVVYGLAWSPCAAANRRDDGVVKVPVDCLRRRAPSRP